MRVVNQEKGCLAIQLLQAEETLHASRSGSLAQQELDHGRLGLIGFRGLLQLVRPDALRTRSAAQLLQSHAFELRSQLRDAVVACVCVQSKEELDARGLGIIRVRGLFQLLRGHAFSPGTAAQVLQSQG